MDFRTTGDVGATGPLAPIPRRILPGIYIHRWNNIGWRTAGYNVLTPPMGVTGGYSKNCNTSAFSEKSRLSLRPAPMPRTYYSNRSPHCPTGRQDLRLTPTARTYASHLLLEQAPPLPHRAARPTANTYGPHLCLALPTHHFSYTTAPPPVQTGMAGEHMHPARSHLAPPAPGDALWRCGHGM